MGIIVVSQVPSLTSQIIHHNHPLPDEVFTGTCEGVEPRGEPAHGNGLLLTLVSCWEHMAIQYF